MKIFRKSMMPYVALAFAVSIGIVIGTMTIANATPIDSGNKGTTGVFMYSDNKTHLNIDRPIDSCVTDKGEKVIFEDVWFITNPEVAGGTLNEDDRLIVADTDHGNKSEYVKVKIFDQNGDGIYDKIEIENFYKYHLVYKGDNGKTITQKDLVVSGSIDKYIEENIKQIDGYEYDTYVIEKDSVIYKYKEIKKPPVGPDEPGSDQTKTGDIIVRIIIALVGLTLVAAIIFLLNKREKE